MRRVVPFLLGIVFASAPLSMYTTPISIVAAENQENLIEQDGMVFQIFGDVDHKSATLVKVNDKDAATLHIPAQIGGANVDSIAFPENEGFMKCKALTAIEVDEENAYFTSVDGVLFTKDKRTLIAYPPALGGAFTLPEETEQIREHAFHGAAGLTELNLCSNLKTVGVSAFAGCTALETIHGKIPGTMGNLFTNCKSLKSISFAESCGEDFDSAMLSSLDLTGCESLTSVSIPESRILTVYAKLTDCNLLHEFTVPNYDGVDFFVSVKDCPKLERITFLKNASQRLTYTLDRSIPTYGYSSNISLAAVCEDNNYPFFAIEQQEETTVNNSEESVKLGDINLDGAVDIMDVILVNKALLGSAKLTNVQETASDVDQNGNVDSTDSLLILKEVVGITINFVEQ